MKVEERQETAAEEAVDSCFLIFLIQSTLEIFITSVEYKITKIPFRNYEWLLRTLVK